MFTLPKRALLALPVAAVLVAAAACSGGGAPPSSSATFGVTLLDFDLPSGIAMLASQGIVDHSLRTTREAGVLAPLRRGRGDPTWRSAGEGSAIWRTGTTPDGHATTRLRRLIPRRNRIPA